MPTNEDLRQRAERLRLYGLLAHWAEARDAGWAASLLDWEESERSRRSLERRLKDARIGRFKPLADFDWIWPTRCDRAAIDALMGLDFFKDAGNAVVVGPNGVGKSTIARNIAHQAVLQGHTVLFTSAGQLLGDLAAIDSASALRRRLGHYAAPALLVIDEVGYLSYSNRHADMLFELINRRYETKSTLSPPTDRSPTGTRSSQAPPASSPWSIASCTTQKSSPSTATLTASRKPPNVPINARVSAGHQPRDDQLPSQLTT
jgi:DNA replication protein DnaC